MHVAFTFDRRPHHIIITIAHTCIVIIVDNIIIHFIIALHTFALVVITQSAFHKVLEGAPVTRPVGVLDIYTYIYIPFFLIAYFMFCER